MSTQTKFFIGCLIVVIVIFVFFNRPLVWRVQHAIKQSAEEWGLVEPYPTLEDCKKMGELAALNLQCVEYASYLDLQIPAGWNRQRACEKLATKGEFKEEFKDELSEEIARACNPEIFRERAAAYEKESQ